MIALHALQLAEHELLFEEVFVVHWICAKSPIEKLDSQQRCTMTRICVDVSDAFCLVLLFEDYGLLFTQRRSFFF